MNAHAKNSGRNTLAAVFWGFALPGLGQVYNGELVKGISFIILLLTASALGIRGALLLPDHLLIYGVLATLILAGALGIYALVDAFTHASRAENSYPLKSYNRWYFYLAFWLLGHVIIGMGQGYMRDHYMEAYKIPTSSMEPGVRQGDHVLADKTAYQRIAPKKGDVVIFANPDNRSMRFIKRIEALPGDVVTRPDGTAQKVPHGFAYVLGDNRARSVDSRHFGFIPLRDIIGKVRQVYFASGTKGILWHRIGTVVGG